MRCVRVLGAAVVATGLAVLPAGVAQAHVTVDPATARKGAVDTTLVFRVPSEQPEAKTVKVRVQFPTDRPLAGVTPLETAGWTSKVKKSPLSAPLKTDEGSITEAVSEIEWTGTINPDHYAELKVLVEELPENAVTLSFKTIQTYDNGKEDAWIDEPSDANPKPEHPAPQLKLVSTLAATTPAAGADETSGSTPATGAGRTVVTEADGDVIAAPSKVPDNVVDQINTKDATKEQFYLVLAMSAVAIVLAGVAIFVARAKPQ